MTADERIAEIELRFGRALLWRLNLVPPPIRFPSPMGGENTQTTTPASGPSTAHLAAPSGSGPEGGEWGRYTRGRATGTTE